MDSFKAANFWKSVTCLDYESIKKEFCQQQRLPYDIGTLIPKLKNHDSLYDIAVGDATHVNILDKIFDFKLLHVSDISSNLIMDAHLGSSSKLPLKCVSHVTNLNNELPPRLSTFSAIIVADIIQYMTDEAIEALCGTCTASELFIVCPVSPKRVGPVEDRYGGLVRTYKQTEKLLTKHRQVILSEDIYKGELKSVLPYRYRMFNVKKEK